MSIPEPVYTEVLCSDSMVTLIIWGILLWIFALIIYYLLKGILRSPYVDPELEEVEE